MANFSNNTLVHLPVRRRRPRWLAWLIAFR